MIQNASFFGPAAGRASTEHLPLFDLRRLFPLWKSAKNQSGEELLNDSEPVRLLVITRSVSDAESLREIARRQGWGVTVASSSAEAASILEQEFAPLVICDCDLPGEDWRAVLIRLAALSRPACVFLASSVVDEYLWKEVIQHHGFDVVTKPFQSDELKRAVTFAWPWRGWPKRHRAEAASQ